MKKVITNVEASLFLEDYSLNSETVLLEEGREKTELEKIVKAKGMSANSRDLGFFKTIYAFSNQPNANGAILPKNELLKVLPQIIGKPININHNRDKVVGHYIDFRYMAKQNKAIAYGAYYKSYYEDLWDEANELFKSKKLSSSFEIWSPKEKRKYLANGSYELHNMEIAGGALIYEDKDNKPAFKNAKVLMMANDATDKPELVYAKKYKQDEILTVGEVVTPQVMTIVKIKCSNCENEFDKGENATDVKCTKCFAILNREGTMIYPPQIKDFKILCPGCKINNWLIISKTDENMNVKCMSCAKEYEAIFAKKKAENSFGKARFIYTGNTSCHQCNHLIPISSISEMGTRELICPKCGLIFSHNVSDEVFKKIAKMNLIQKKENAPVKSSKKETTKVVELIEVEDVEAIKKQIEGDNLDVAKTSNLPRSLFAVVTTVKDKKTETPKLVTIFPMYSRNSIRDALVRLKDKSVDTALKGLGVNIESIKTKLVRRGKELKLASLLKRYKKAVGKHKDKLRKKRKKIKEIKQYASEKEAILKAGVRKIVKKHLELKKELEEAKKQAEQKVEAQKQKTIKETVKVTKELENKVEFYKENAKKIVDRQLIIGKETLSDEDIINDDKFEKVNLQLELAKIKSNDNTATEVAGSKINTPTEDAKNRKKINDIAFGNKEKEEKR